MTANNVPFILWQNADGQASIWELDGANMMIGEGSGPVSPDPTSPTSGRQLRLHLDLEGT
jgi:hypothetical protein